MSKKITINPKIMVGKPVIKGTRIPVYLILNLLKEGYDFNRIIKAYPELSNKDIKVAIEYAENLTKYEEEVIPSSGIVYA
ncbi:DUF433 domain-containing protein [Patescibacteria group bacterium]